MEKSELRELFESEYPGKKAIFEKLIQPIFAKAKDATLTDNQILSDSDKKQIKSFSIIAQVRGGFPITFADVEVQDSVTLKRSRVNIQNCVRKMMANDSNAIIFFHFTDNKNEWRVSYCHRATTNKESTDAKRFTYLCGTDHACRTIAERFDTLQGLSTIKDEDMLEAFGVEPLSKEFFDRYREHYADLVEYISGKRFVKKGGKFVEEKTKNANGAFKSAFDGDDKLVRDYVKKMMGRLVFLHFLQKKGWLGVPQKEAWGNGDKNFIFNLFKNANNSIKSDFLELALVPLFFKTLNTDRGDESLAPMEICNIFGKKIRIPYLNGGLFEEDELDKKKVKFKQEHFEELLDFFNQYNFTIDETDPDDQEIGVDPEMLGKIFENLLEDNKDKGAFYTPKEIVQYMCRESLIAYLEEKTGLDTRDFVINHTNQFTKAQQADVLDALLKVKVCDPAVGSGAFPMGMMNELLACTQLLIGEGKTRSQLKKHIVKNNIYGVDIEKGAIDIARLRFWLAIIVDENEPIPLPNLDYKIMQGNSLLECYEGIDLSTLTQKDENSLFDNAEAVTQLRKAVDGFYIPSDHIAKAKIRKQINEKVIQLLKERGFSDLVLNELKSLDLHSNNQFFLWHTWFSDVFNRPNDCNGFDIVIGNPPYVESRNSIFSDEVKDNLQRDVRTRYKEEDRRSFPRGADLLIFFFELSFRLLNKNGINTFITENSWLSTDYGKDFQTYLLKYIDIQGIVDSDYKYFETADINTIISFFKLNNDNKVLPVNFFHTHENLEKYPCNTSNPKLNNDCIELKTFKNTDSILKKYKWGFIYSTDKKLIDLVEKMDNLQDLNIKKKISIGQGLNLTKDKILKNKTKNCAPFFTSETGPVLTWTETETYVDRKNISCSRKIPLLILPRGLGTHFCCMNEISGYSTSFVEIYEEEELTEMEKLNLWLFCNSSLLWLLREYTGRCNLGGGMLKAEATDLKTIPLCFNFGEDSEIKNIFKLAKNYCTPGKIEIAINSDLHKRIDKIVYSYFGLEQENNFVTEMLVTRFNWRNKKSKTN